MIPIKLQPPPTDFADKVYTPGQDFLKSVGGSPTEEQWDKHPFWRRSLKYSRKVYNKICAYCATKITYSTGNGSIDHFISRKTNPSLAYTWSNFRYASARFNSRKGTRVIADPFKMTNKWYIIDFTSMMIRTNKRLSKKNYILAEYTLDILQLNDDDDLIEERTEFYQDYVDGKSPIEVLARVAPFIASELRRQKITPKVKNRGKTPRRLSS